MQAYVPCICPFDCGIGKFALLNYEVILQASVFLVVICITSFDFLYKNVLFLFNMFSDNVWPVYFTPVADEGHGSLTCGSTWSHKELDMTE